jgi:hypothetical protein
MKAALAELKTCPLVKSFGSYPSVTWRPIKWFLGMLFVQLRIAAFSTDDLT